MRKTIAAKISPTMPPAAATGPTRRCAGPPADARTGFAQRRQQHDANTSPIAAAQSRSDSQIQVSLNSAVRLWVKSEVDDINAKPSTITTRPRRRSRSSAPGPTPPRRRRSPLADTAAGGGRGVHQRADREDRGQDVQREHDFEHGIDA